ncbi:MAG: hypothetical protein GY926_11555 [bacterium]|nr:hypothetical protein [bacterium]
MIRITVSDPDTGEVFETKDLADDYLIICEGTAEESSVQSYANGTQVITVKNPRPRDSDTEPYA